jgi:hypothetical protein
MAGISPKWIKAGRCKALRTALSLAIQFCHGIGIHPRPWYYPSGYQTAKHSAHQECPSENYRFRYLSLAFAVRTQTVSLTFDGQTTCRKLSDRAFRCRLLFFFILSAGRLSAMQDPIKAMPVGIIFQAPRLRTERAANLCRRNFGAVEKRKRRLAFLSD